MLEEGCTLVSAIQGVSLVDGEYEYMVCEVPWVLRYLFKNLVQLLFRPLFFVAGLRIDVGR